MRHLLGFTIFALLVSLGAARGASAATHYIAANGSDSNNGTTKTTPWLHAPGMANCFGTCGSYSPVAGDKFIFRGGDTWHYAASTAPAMGGGWTWTWSGSSGSNIYIGVDKTWYTGASWVRPIVTFDNPTSTSVVSSCPHEGGGLNFNGQSYITFDNFELTGMCALAGDSPTMFNMAAGATYVTVSNSYFHGWTQDSVTGSVVFLFYGNNSHSASFDNITGNVFDGSDTYCTGAGACEGWLSYGEGYNFNNNVARYLSNGLNSPGNIYTIHDNLFEYFYESADATQHGGIIESGGNTGSAGMYIYNNIFRNTNIGITVWPEPYQNLYFFNNVYWNIGNSGNCFLIDGASEGPTVDQTLYFYNNTVDQPCTVRFYGAHSGQQFIGTGYFENNHLIGSTSLPYSVDSGATATIHDEGGEVYQTEAVANGQGYVTSNNYAPTAGTNATISAGANLTSSCTTFSSDSALCSGTSGSVTEGAGNVANYSAITINARPSSGAWNAGAYQFSLSSVSQPNPPTGLTASVE